MNRKEIWELITAIALTITFFEAGLIAINGLIKAMKGVTWAFFIDLLVSASIMLIIIDYARISKKVFEYEKEKKKKL